MNVNEYEVSDRRLEIKMLIPHARSEWSELCPRFGSEVFEEQFAPRWINNIYFDSYCLDAYRDNLEGVGNRQKVRLRWYGGHWRATHPTLELKVKEGRVGHKVSSRLPIEFDLSADPDLARFRRAFEASLSSGQRARIADSGIPVLINRYFRRYFVSRDGQLRLTVDSQLEYYDLLGRCTFDSAIRVECHRAVIMEFKAAPDMAGALAQAVARMPFRITRSSKYIEGVRLSIMGAREWSNL